MDALIDEEIEYEQFFQISPIWAERMQAVQHLKQISFPIKQMQLFLPWNPLIEYSP